jgi:O-acetyl-ADP-ribose deacetylase (regulator of RNase III)
MPGRIRIIEGDITELALDAIVNAANSSLLGGGGVDGAIHRAAGPKLLEECRKIGGCPTGEARITKGYDLPAKYVIHTVGPVWSSGKSGEDELLASCYRNSLQLAVENDIHTLAFPAISTGIYRFPLKRATKIAIRETRNFLKNHPEIDEVTFCCFDDRTASVYHDLL